MKVRTHITIEKEILDKAKEYGKLVRSEPERVGQFTPGDD